MKRRKVLASFAGLAGVSGIGASVFYTSWMRQDFIQKTELGEYKQNTEFDVCIIGTGPAGCVMADELRKKGKKIILLESGYSLENSSGMQKVSLLDKYSSGGNIDYPLQSSRFRALGGTSNIWTGRCPRYLPSDFSNNPLAPTKNWPISYTDIQPYYVMAEETLSVEGGPLNEYHAPRKADLNGPKINIEELEDLLNPLNIKVDYPPVSNKRFLFLKKGPIRFYRDYLPTISEDQNVNLITGATVTKINTNGNGLVTSVTAQSVDGGIQNIAARKYVIACGAVESIRLLQLSANKYFPGGVGNHSGLLGRFFMEHPWKDYSTELPLSDEFEKNHLGRTFQYCDELKSRGLGGIILGFYTYPPNKMKIGLGIEMAPLEQNRIDLNSQNLDAFGYPGANIKLQFSTADENLWKEGEAIVTEIYKKLGSGQVDKKEYIHWSHHHMGGTRMGNLQNDGVVDRNLKVFNTDNLYVMSSSVFVTSGVANPTLTIVALAHRLAEHIIKLT